MKKTDLNVRRILLPHLLTLLTLCIAMQIFIAARGSHIDAYAQGSLALIALYYAYFNYANNRKLKKIRFGKLVAHAVGYVIVNVSFFAHALILFAVGSTAIIGDTSDFPIDAGWFGALFGMSVFWGLGFLIHSIASVAMRGYEDLDG